MQQVLPGGAMCDLVVVNLPTVQDTNYVLFPKMSWKCPVKIEQPKKIILYEYFNEFTVKKMVRLVYAIFGQI